MLFFKVNYSVNPVTYVEDGVVLIYALGMIGSLFLLLMLLFNSRKSSNDKPWMVMRIYLKEHNTQYQPISNQEYQNNKNVIELIKSLIN